MRRAFSRSIRTGQPDARERIAERMAWLRMKIEQQRREAIRLGRGEAVTRLDDPVAQRRLRWRAIAAAYKPHQEVRDKIAAMLAADESARDELTIELAEEFLQVAEHGNASKLRTFIEEGFPVDFQDPETGESVLHIVAACQARKALRVILQSGEYDFLLRDKRGRLPSEIAYLYGNDPALARLLGIKERKQAGEQGIELTRRPALTVPSGTSS